MTNLRGVGGATRIEKLLTSVTDYALQTVLIVDDEGDMRPTVDRLMADGLLDPDDVLIQDTSFEESNFTDEELVHIATRLAAIATDKRPAATLTMNASELRAYHDDRVHRSTSKDKPGFADSLTRRARDEARCRAALQAGVGRRDPCGTARRAGRRSQCRRDKSGQPAVRSSTTSSNASLSRSPRHPLTGCAAAGRAVRGLGRPLSTRPSLSVSRRQRPVSRGTRDRRIWTRLPEPSTNG